MTSDEILSVFISPILHEGARQSEISKLNSHVGCFLPQAYIDLMMRTNGVEGFVSHEIYVILWPVEHILDLNVGYGVSEFAPGFFLYCESTEWLIGFAPKPRRGVTVHLMVGFEIGEHCVGTVDHPKTPRQTPHTIPQVRRSAHSMPRMAVKITRISGRNHFCWSRFHSG